MQNLDTARAALKKYFGYETFRDLQSRIIEAIYAGRDSLVLMPTGGGKSICYQIPGITLPGTCIVISPLISLMKDQVEGLKVNGVRAAFMNSSLSNRELRAREDQLLAGELDLLYVSPEKLGSAGFLPLLQRTRINLFAIDEAHCISAWGHDFRPEYTQLGFLRQQFPQTPVVALTATADKLTREDIIRQLALQEPAVFVASFDRPNISLEVRPGQKRYEQILRFIRQHPDQPGIIYCLSRKSTEKLADKLQAAGLNARAYHAGLRAEERSEVQSSFINDQTQIVCATIAFGMGIDKSNVRWVIHYNLPKNLESYYQEIGRAGRDGVRADTLLFYSFHDIVILREIIGSGNAGQVPLQLAKLERMQQYAEAIGCRRRILLGYFDEDYGRNCGNCDNCKNPPEVFDGTIIAQKALSAVYRLRQKAPMGLVIDLLRGSGKKEIREKGLDRIKTYGAGRDIPYSHWQQYFLQLLNLGYLDIAYHDGRRVRLKPASKKVLTGSQTVELVNPDTIRQRQEKAEQEAKQRRAASSLEDDLFQLLRQLRKRLAQENGIPPYQIFSDATLLQMCRDNPLNDEQMLKISGVGERKLHRYGDAFLNIILDFVDKRKASVKGSTYQVTMSLLEKGMSIPEIADKRDLNPATVYAHLAYLYEQDYPVELSPHISPQDIQTICQSLRYLQKPLRLKDVFDYFSGEYSYDQIRLALAYAKKNPEEYPQAT